SLPRDKVQPRNANLNAASRDVEAVATVGFGEAAVALGDVRRDGKCGAVQLVGEEELAARQVTRQCANRIGEEGRLLVDLEFLEGEGHLAPLDEKVESGKETAGGPTAIRRVG